MESPKDSASEQVREAERRRYMCLRKKPWPDEISAKRWAIAKEFQEQLPWSWYKCSYGDHWHTGHTNKRVDTPTGARAKLVDMSEDTV
jgi:hypothetical protein